ncbi:hypothetical protein PA25_35670 [Pseudoalteromonas sp. A25]|uniref:PEP/pyruvate-binding domain-containing protein n=1 Tax=Pseudoalteromonas sp. A25 TaxID=116092 RepID=UPI001260C562|nr:PEP/pyruvate-binding domain-containing protein [Pseudoalteromonas sp. A25]BBN83582.1 hypothetical protein PA25_35670 [Pseudoalteromonas sp. A25]
MNNTVVKSSTSITEHVVGFANAPKNNVSLFGGKGAVLCDLYQAGLPVPNGFCISIDMFKAFIAHYDLLAKHPINEGIEQWRSLAKAIIESSMPSELADLITCELVNLSGPVAVRSSATDEDGQSHSFAGQHLTKLGQQGESEILDAVKACWASAFSDAAYEYRKATGQQTELPTMAVVVQQMKFGDVSGVAFGQHPTSLNKNEFLIEGCFGLCEGLVSGQVSSDSFVIDKQTNELISQSIQNKQQQIVYLDGQIKKVDIPKQMQSEPTLDPMTIKSLGKLLHQVEDFYGKAQDVEWTLSEGKLWLLQSRPITSIAQDNSDDNFYLGNRSEQLQKDILWSRMDIGEIFTGRMTPLGLSFARYYQSNVHIECGKGLGLLDLGEADETMAYYRGHVYLNVSYTAWQLAQTPVGKDQTPFLVRFSSEAIDLTGYKNPYGEQHSHPNYSSGQCVRHWIKQNIREFFQAKRRAKTMVESRFREYDRVQLQNIDAMDLSALQREMTHALKYFKAMHEGYLPYYINAFACYGLLEELSAQWLGDKSKHLQNQIKGDMSNLRTVASAQELWQLCQTLEQWPNVRDAFASQTISEIDSFLNNTTEGLRFSQGPLAKFMRENGVRAREEMELTHPRWLDDRTYVLQMIKLYLAQGYEVDEALQQQQQQQQLTSEDLLKELSWSKRWVIKRVIALYCGCAKLREETRMSMITSIWLVRRVVFEVAKRLVEAKHLDHIDDVAYLNFEQILQYLEGMISATELTSNQALQARRAQYQSWLARPEPPLTFIGKPSSQPDLILDPTATSLQGLATSKGFIEGKACVITDLANQVGEFKKGDILIAPFTDASWTPLFALASAVVTDIGSMLSHSSIVAREFGIPCVVNTNHASALIKTGDHIIVDAETGLITLKKDD